MSVRMGNMVQKLIAFFIAVAAATLHPLFLFPLTFEAEVLQTQMN